MFHRHALVAMAALALACAPALAQNHGHEPRDVHPDLSRPGAIDPYESTMSFRSAQFPAGLNCCHGRDCARFHGTPVRGSKGGRPGLWFGRWFVEQDRLIDPRTLPASERGYHHLCVMDAGTAREHVMCGYEAGGV